MDEVVINLDGTSMKNTEISAEIGLPFGVGKIAGKWAPDAAESSAAWEVLVELCTRVTLVPVTDGQGSLREVLDSLRAMFQLVRDLLKKYGPDVAASRIEDSTISFGYLSVALLNGSVRPFLTKWHTELRVHEESRPAGTGVFEWERAWPLAGEMRRELSEVQASIRLYAGLLARASGGESLLSAATFRSFSAVPSASD